jgi:hypothetical protein
MLKPNLRLLILPLGAVSMIATLSSQNVPQAAQRESMIQQVRQEIVACTPNSNADICIVSEKTPR